MSWRCDCEVEAVRRFLHHPPASTPPDPRLIGAGWVCSAICCLSPCIEAYLTKRQLLSSTRIPLSGLPVRHVHTDTQEEEDVLSSVCCCRCCCGRSCWSTCLGAAVFFFCACLFTGECKQLAGPLALLINRQTGVLLVAPYFCHSRNSKVYCTAYLSTY